MQPHTYKGNNTTSTITPIDVTVAQLMSDLGAAPLNSPSFSGTPTAPSPATSDNSTNIATTSWVRGLIAGTGTIPSIYVQDTPPIGAVPGSLWWNSATGLLYVYYQDPSGTQWVFAASNPGVVPGTPGGSGVAIAYVQDTPPIGAMPGSLWWNSTTGFLYIYYQDPSGSQWVFASSSPSITIIPGYLYGMTLSTLGVSPNFTVGAGQACDSGFHDMMSLPTAMTKSTLPWSPGSDVGALDTGTITPNTWYHVFVIESQSLQLVDVLISLSLTAPTLPSGYNLFRRIGSMRTSGSSNWVSFVQNGDEFLWSTPFLDANIVTVTPTAALISVTTPPGIKCWARMRANTASSVGTGQFLINSPDETTTAAANPAGNTITNIAAIGTGFPTGELTIRTNITSQVRVISNISLTMNLVTYGYIDHRGRE